MINFSIERMSVVSERINDIQAQLTTAINKDAEILENIASHIQTTDVSELLKKYAEANIEKANDTNKLLEELNTYLLEQISAYTRSNQTHTDTLSEVQSILDQI